MNNQEEPKKFTSEDFKKSVEMFREIPKGFNIIIIESPLIREGQGVLQLHPSDFKRYKQLNQNKQT